MALTPFKSKLIADVGISMGDEGKGRLIPEIVRELQTLTGRRDVVGTVLKVNGGANSGHTAPLESVRCSGGRFEVNGRSG